MPTFNRDEISISGSFSEAETKDLALVLRFGALPVQLKPEAVNTVSATLGKDSLRAGIVAGLVGLALVLALMLIYYRSLGLVVFLGLLVSAALLWSIISYLGESRGLALTLAGATGIIVSIGVTVDSYVVFFERLKDDVHAGKTLRTSAPRGFQSAYRTNPCATRVVHRRLVLWKLTVGSVRGFAFSSAIDSARPRHGLLLHEAARDPAQPQRSLQPGQGVGPADGHRGRRGRHAMTTLDERPVATPTPEKQSVWSRLYRGETTFDFIRNRKVGFIISGLILLASVISLSTRGLNLGIDFKGGVAWSFPHGVSTSDVDGILSSFRPRQGPPRSKRCEGSESKIRVQVGPEGEAKQNDVQQAFATAAKVGVGA